jgi:branched-chain amino acid transport system ATP-binding protein
MNERASSGTLELKSVCASYDRTPVLRNIDFEVPAGSVVALLGANGAGKTTLLRVISGLLRPTAGDVTLDGSSLTGLRASQRARSGLCLIPEGRGIFRALTVRENLELFVPPWHQGPKDVEPAVAAFPVLGERLGQVAGSLSGGEQQMLSLSRAYLASPRIVLADELSMGLAPLVIEDIYQRLLRLNALGIGLLIVEQFVTRALEVADYVYVMVRGEIGWHGPRSELSEDVIASSYLDTHGGS